MLRSARRIAATLLVVSASTVHAQSKPQGEPSKAAVAAALNALGARVIELMKKGDAAGIAAMYAPDAVLVAPTHATITGRANIERAYTDMLATTRIVDYKSTSTGLEVSGDLAVDNGTYTETFQNKGKAPVAERGRYLMVFRNVNGQWLAVRDFETPDPPAAKR